MSTRSKPPTDTFDGGTGPDFGDDDVTVVDGALLVEETITPVEPPLCPECGKIVTIDSFVSHPSYPDDRCVTGPTGKWHSCATLRKAVFYW